MSLLRDLRNQQSSGMGHLLETAADEIERLEQELSDSNEALAERDRLGYAVVNVIGKLDEIIEQLEEIELNDFNHVAISSELWHELETALEEMPSRALINKG